MRAVKMTLSELFNNEDFDELTKEYTSYAINQMIPKEIDKASFYNMESLGLLDVVGLYKSNSLIGYSVASTTKSPHYNKLVTHTISLFVTKINRGKGSARLMVKKIEELAKGRGAELVILSLPADKKFSRFASILGYEPTHNLHCKNIENKVNNLATKESLPMDLTMPKMSTNQLAKAKSVEGFMESLEPIICVTQHTLSGGLYSRTLFMPKNTIVYGVLIKVPTTLILSGKMAVFIGDETKHIDGYNVINTLGARRQIVYAMEDSYATLVFKTDAKTIEEAEMEMTNEYDDLMSRQENSINIVNITGVV